MSSETGVAALLLTMAMIITLHVISKSLGIPYSQLADGVVAYIAFVALITAREGGER